MLFAARPIGAIGIAAASAPAIGAFADGSMQEVFFDEKQIGR
jgi:hypothetical protein